jgi:hypothetical protein
MTDRHDHSDASSQGACPNCGYSRAGLPRGLERCPECGELLAPQLSQASHQWLVTVRAGLRLLVWGGGLALAVPLCQAGITVGSMGSDASPIRDPVLLAAVPLAMAGVGVWVLCGCFLTGMTLLRARQWSVATLGALCAAAGVSLMGRHQTSLAHSFGLSPWQVGGLLGWTFLALLLAWSTVARIVLAEACALSGVARAAAVLRRWPVALPVLVLILLGAANMRWQMRIWILGPRTGFSSGTAAQPPLAERLTDYALGYLGMLAPLPALAAALGVWCVAMVVLVRVAATAAPPAPARGG